MANAARKTASAKPVTVVEDTPDTGVPQVDAQQIADDIHAGNTVAAPEAAATKSEAELKREAYSAAETRLRREHNERFRELVMEEAKQRGVEYTFKKSPEEKAAEQIAALLAEHPHLADQFKTATA